MTNDELFDIMHDYVVYATGLSGSHVRQARPDQGVKPEKDRSTIVSIGFINPTNIGTDSILYKNIDGDNLNVVEVVKADRRVTASILILGADAGTIADKISYNLNRSGAKEIFYNSGNGIGILGRGQIQNLSEIQNGSFGEIRQIDIELHVEHIYDMTINAINSVNIEANVIHETQILTNNIEVIAQ